MILTVTLNPALDVTYRLPRLRPGQVQRVPEVLRRAGGKGVNVAAVAAGRGADVIALVVADTPFARAVEDLGVTADLVPAMTHVRQTLVIQAEETTSLWEPGSAVPPGTDELVHDHLERHLADLRVLVVSGSLAPGIPADLPARLAERARAAGAVTLLDLDDTSLEAAADAGGSILVPNEDELARLVGAHADPVAATRALAHRTGAPVVHTRGEHGLVAVADEQVWRVRSPRVVGNPTGAGDATAAGIALGSSAGSLWPERLRLAAALGAAAVATPTAGTVDAATFDLIHPAVEITQLH